MNESYQKLVSRQVMHEQDGPQLLAGAFAAETVGDFGADVIKI